MRTDRSIVNAKCYQEYKTIKKAVAQFNSETVTNSFFFGIFPRNRRVDIVISDVQLQQKLLIVVSLDQGSDVRITNFEFVSIFYKNILCLGYGSAGQIIYRRRGRAQ